MRAMMATRGGEIRQDPPAAWPRYAAMGAGGYTVVAGLITLAGWVTDTPWLTDWKADGISMFPNAAVCAVLSGGALLVAQIALRRSETLLRALAAATSVIAGLTLLEHVTGINLGIDTLLFERPWGQIAAAAPMRMGPPASLSFLLTGTGLILLTSGAATRTASAALGGVVLAIGTLSFIGHLYGASPMYMLPRLTGIAMQTASVVVAVGLGLLLSVPEREPMRTLLEPTAAGMLTRRALPMVVLLALTLGAARVFIEGQGLVDGAFATALRTVLELGLLTGLLWWAAAKIRAHELALNRSESEGRRQAAQLAAFLDTAAVAVHRVDADGTILWANDAELAMLGYVADEYIGHHIAEFHVDAGVVADILARLRRGEKLAEYPAQMRCKDGGVKDVLIDSSAFWQEGQFLHTQCFTRDVTASNQAERVRARLAAIVESSDDAIVSKDLNGIITSWNHGAERLFGYTAAEAIGRPVTILIPPEYQDEEPSILKRVRSGHRIDHYETVRVTKDGTRVPISLTVSPMRDGQGRIIGASKIARDITDRVRGAQEREQLLRVAEVAREQAETANRAKDEFLAMLGHELRNPLSAVRNAIAVAALDQASRNRAIEIARRQTDQLGRIVDDLLDVARITQGRVGLRKERVVLSDILQRAVDGARALMGERGHTLTLALPSEPIRLDADPARLEQALGNLLANAAKYTDPGGTVTVTAEREDGQAVIRVRDNGMGIAPELLPRVFDLFAQGERSLERAQGGLGIGLTVVRRIAELHGGTAEASSPGRGLGAEFTIRLPALVETMDEATVKLVEDARGQIPEGRSARVLMVEDHPDAAESLVLILELLGHHVRVVHDGVAALDAVRANIPDIMLIDIGLPGMSGYEVAQAIRRDPSLKHLVLVALTGYGRPEDKAQALAAGFDYHLAKPVDLDALGNLVARLGARAEPNTPTRH